MCEHLKWKEAIESRRLRSGERNLTQSLHKLPYVPLYERTIKFNYIFILILFILLINYLLVFLGIVKKLPFELIQHQQTINHEFIEFRERFQSVVEGSEASTFYFFNEDSDFKKYSLTWNSCCTNQDIEGWFKIENSETGFLLEHESFSPKFRLCKATGKLLVLDMGTIEVFNNFGKIFVLFIQIFID